MELNIGLLKTNGENNGVMMDISNLSGDRKNVEFTLMPLLLSLNENFYKTIFYI